MSNNPKWFVQTADGTLYGYFTLDILLCDLSTNRGERVVILEQVPSFKVCYKPVTEAELRERKAS